MLPYGSHWRHEVVLDILTELNFFLEPNSIEALPEEAQLHPPVPVPVLCGNLKRLSSIWDLRGRNWYTIFINHCFGLPNLANSNNPICSVYGDLTGKLLRVRELR